MAEIIFIHHSGEKSVVEASDGMSVMNAAVDNGVAGIDADCGGECSCATCHVLVDEGWLSKVGSISTQEENMLDLNPDRQSNSRLSCQIAVTDELDGIVINLPEFQY
ncbi:MAG: 2Fe-2S iron-sulfur cluster binding domain-containing protein [Pseudomonadales bacterium]|nr:2Fe-2S iron-sulfur cluster binding domain-containing protein [Pseudomonadales bacterium]